MVHLVTQSGGDITYENQNYLVVVCSSIIPVQESIFDGISSLMMSFSFTEDINEKAQSDYTLLENQEI
jgi:hypothetical protein